MLLGFALTQHCNLRCTNCGRDDVTQVAELDVEAVLRISREARDMFPQLRVSFTGGEPMLHRGWARLVEGLKESEIPYMMVSNGWHMQRMVPLIDRYRPFHVRLSLSGASEAVHDAERGRDSFRRVQLATAILISRRVPVSYAFLIDRRSRHQLADAVRFASDMGAFSIHFAIAQPVPGSAHRDTDLGPAEWWEVRRELDALEASAAGGTRIIVDHGLPFTKPAHECMTMKLERVYVNVHGRISTCCQLSEYGGNDADEVADVLHQPFAVGYQEYVRRIEALRIDSQPMTADDPLAPFPCMRCAKANGKLTWLGHFPNSPWNFVAADAAANVTMVAIHYSPRGRRVEFVGAEVEQV